MNAKQQNLNAPAKINIVKDRITPRSERYKKTTSFIAFPSKAEEHQLCCYSNIKMDSELITSAAPSRATTATNNEVPLSVPHVWLESTSNDVLWMEKYRRLQAFHEANKHCRVPKSSEDRVLATWVSNQRSFQRAGTLRKDREQLLNDLGFTWSTPTAKKIEALPESWMNRYNQLVAYKKSHGHFQVTTKEDAELNRWLNTQRIAKRAGSLHKQRQALLDQIGFVWDVKPVPPNPSPLAPVHTLDFKPAVENEEAWNKMFARLLEYSVQHGHTYIQANAEDQELAQWVDLQRNLRKLGRLEAKREKDLCEIGFSWELHVDESVNNDRHMSMKDEELWMSQFRLLCEFEQMHGHVMVPRTGETSALYQWMFVQQRLMERGRLPEDKKKSLESLLTAHSSSPVTAPLSSASSVALAASIAEASAALKSGFSPSNVPARLGDEPRGTSSESVTSSILLKEAPKNNQKFAIGTRIERYFEVDGKLQPFGGNVTAFELYEEEDGTKAWGYFIEYDDGDKEHLLEADVAKNLVIAKSVKRAAKSQGKTMVNKRMKQGNVSGNDSCSTMSIEKTTELVPEQVNTTIVSKKSGSAVQATNTTSDTIRSTKGQEKSRARAETKEAPKDGSKSRVSRLRDAKLSRSPGDAAHCPTVTKNSVTDNSATKKKEVLTKRRAIYDSDSDSSSSEDEPLHSLARKQVQTKEEIQAGVKDKSIEKEKKIEHDIIDLLDDEDDDDEWKPVDDTTPTPPLHNQSHETSTPRQKFPKGTLISRKFFDLSDNEREKSYRGKVVDYVYRNEEKDWLYFIKYDDGDKEFMDEWEVAKFSLPGRS